MSCITLFIASLNPNLLSAQQNWVCGNDFLPPPSTPESYSCAQTSPTFINKYRTPGFYTPNKSNICIKTIMVNLVIVHRDDGSGGLQPSAHTEQDFQTMLDGVNNTLQYIQPRSYSLICPVPTNYITDAKIRFEVNEVYHVNNTVAYNNTSLNVSAVNTYIRNTYPSANGAINLIVYPINYGSAAGFWNGTYLATNQIYPIPSDPTDTYMYYDPWIYCHLIHEFGHALNLDHLYNSGGSQEITDITHFDFLDDIFGTCPDPCESDPTKACFNPPPPFPCNPPPQHVCHFACWDCWAIRLQTPNVYPMMSGKALDKIYLSPKQAGQMHRALMLRNYPSYFNMHRYVKEKYPAPNDYIISSDETWDFEIQMYQNIVIKPGVTLTIQCTVYMPIDGKIIVKPGGRLIIDGGTVTCAHNGELWQGIEVWGNSNQHQYPFSQPTYQGKLTVINGGIIENAWNAVTTWHPGDWNSMGGVIYCNDATFRNNKRSVEFIAYQNYLPSTGNPVNNISRFFNTTFEVNNGFLGNSFNTHVTMWGVDGVNFKQCTFANNMTSNLFTSFGSNKGIYSIDATYTVGGNCNVITPIGQPCPWPSILPTVFKGLETGIHATNAGGLYALNVYNSKFENNLIGMHTENVDNYSATRNEFLLGQHTIQPSQNYLPIPLGLWSRESTGYRIEENKFTEVPSPIDETKGILMRNSGMPNNEIYKNNFTDLNFGIEARKVNKNGNDDYQGLQILCNEFQQNSNSEYDIIVNADPPATNPQQYIPIHQGIRTFQGDFNPQLSAGNIFSQSGNNPESDIKNRANPFFYFHTGGTTQPLYYTDFTMPAWAVYPNMVSIANTCASNLDDGILFPLQASVVTDIANQYNDFSDDFNNAFANYNTQINDGKTDSLLYLIDNGTQADAWDIFNELQTHSPWLSWKVIKAAGLSNIFPDIMLRDICLSNPDAIRSEYYLHFLTTQISNPLDTAMLDTIRSSWNTITARTQLLSELAHYSSGMAFNANMLITNLMLDSNGQQDAIRNFLTDRATLADRYLLAESYLRNGNFARIDSIMDSITDNYILNAYQNEEYDDYVAYFNIRQTFGTDAAGYHYNSIARLDSTQVSQLQVFADTAVARPATMAWNILCFFYQICRDYSSDTLFNKSYTGESKDVPKATVQKASDVKVYPNPAHTYTTFQWNLPDLQKDATITVRDITGRLIKTKTIYNTKGQWLWDTRHVPSGTYLYSIANNEQRFAVGKIIVTN